MNWQQIPRASWLAFVGSAALCLFLLALAGAFFDDVVARGIYQVLREWQTLIAATIALATAINALRPVWRQVRTAGAQAALNLLAVVERDAGQVAIEKKVLGAFWSLLGPLHSGLRDFDTKPFKEPLHDAFFDIANADLTKAETLTSRITLDPHARLMRQELMARLSLLEVTAAFEHGRIQSSDYDRDVVKEAFEGLGPHLAKMIMDIRALLDSLNDEEQILRDRAIRLRRSAADLPG